MLRLIISLLLLCASAYAQALSYTHEITEQELQEKVSAMMPMQKKKFFITVVLSNPKVALLEGQDRIRIFSHIEVMAPKNIGGSGDVQITGSLSYDPEQGSFHLNDPEIESLTISQLPEKHIPKVKKITQLIVSKFLSARPVYRLKDENLKHKLAKSVLESISIKNKVLIVELSLF